MKTCWRRDDSLRRWLGLVVVVVALSASCGTSASVAVQDVAADQALAEQALLTASDMGPGWSSQPRDDEDADPDTAAIFERLFRAESACSPLVDAADAAGLDLSDFDLGDLVDPAPVDVESPTLVSDASVFFEVEHDIEVYATAEDALAPFKVARDVNFVDCSIAVFEDAFQAAFDAEDQGFVISDYKGSENPVGVGDDELAFRIEFSTSTPDGGGDFDLVSEFSVVAVGRVVTIVNQLIIDDDIDDIEDMDAIAATAFDKVVATFDTGA